MNYINLDDGESIANNHANKFEYDAYSTNVSAFGESMIQMDEISLQSRVIYEAELELNIERRKDANQDQEKQRIEVLVFDEEQKRSQTELNQIKFKNGERGLDHSTYYSQQNLEEQLLNPKGSREHYSKSQLELKKQKWMKSRKYQFIEKSQDLETSIWKKKTFNIILIDYTYFMKNADKRSDLKTFLEKEMNKSKQINEIHIYFKYQREYKDYILSQINLLRGFKQLSAITINLVGKEQNIGIKEKELYKIYFKKLNLKSQNKIINFDIDQIDTDVVREINEVILSNSCSLKEIYLSLPDLTSEAMANFNDFMIKEGYKNRQMCHLEFLQSKSINIFIDRLKNIPPSLGKLSLKFDNLDSSQQQLLANELQSNNVSNLSLYIGGKINIQIQEFITHCTLKYKSYKLSFNSPISSQQFNQIQENFKFLPKTLNKFQLELQVQDQEELNLDPICFSNIPKSIKDIGIILHNTLNKKQTQNLGAIITQLPIYTNSINLELNNCDTDVLDYCFSIEYIDLDKLQLSIEKNLFPEQFTCFLKKIPQSTYHMKLALRDYYIYDLDNKNEYIQVLSQLTQRLDYIVLDLGVLNSQNASILKSNIKYIKSDIIIILARYSDKDSKSILQSISKSNSSEIKIHFY